MLETSKDLLNLTIAFCILWLTAFLCWLIFYFAMIMRGINLIIERFTKTLEAMTAFFNKAKEKVENLSGNFAMVMEAAKKVSDFIKNRKKTKAEKQNPK